MTTVPDHLRPLVERLRRAPLESAPSPWQLRAVHAVGGLTDVGFGRGSDLLLVLSANGRGVFDGATGARVARDPELDGDQHDERELAADGIGPLLGQRVPTSGLAGGGLALRTADGWAAERVVLEWPDEMLLLVPPGAWLYETRSGRSASFTKLRVERSPRAFGFSPTGRTLVVATSSDLMIYGRP